MAVTRPFVSDVTLAVLYSSYILSFPREPCIAAFSLWRRAFSSNPSTHFTACPSTAGCKIHTQLSAGPKSWL